MLPIHEALPALKAVLREGDAAVLVAPPGAGKTTVVPLALMEEPWASGGRLIVLEPRRLAARAAARRMAETLGEEVGRTIGFRVRGESRTSPATRVEVVTEGVFTRMILADPGLDGIAGVLFDEFHERSLDADLGLAFARDSQAVLREDLRLLVMSATLDGGRISALLGGAPVIESLGRAYPVDTRYLGRDQTKPLELQVATAVQRAMQAEVGSILVFLPGVPEIRRTERRLQDVLGDRCDVLLAPLYGALDMADQERAIAPAPAEMRKVVLATSIAETSLTIEGVRVVVDSGLSRRPRHDPGTGLTRLVTVRVSRASSDQRRGRAGRTEPGVCYRLWDEPETRGLVPSDRPEMLESDLAGVALDLAAWGAPLAKGLALLDPPPSVALAESRAMLARLGALEEGGGLTEHGRALQRLPLPPRLGHMVLRGAAAGEAELAARAAAVLSERGLGGGSSNLWDRLEALDRDRSRRAEQARSLAARWAALAKAAHPASVARLGVGGLLASAYPERVARARGGAGQYQLLSGRGAWLDPADGLARHEWLAVGEMASGGARDRILLAAPIDEALVRKLFESQLAGDTVVEVDGQGRPQARRETRLGVLVLDSRPAALSPTERAEALGAHIRENGFSILRHWPELQPLLARLALARTLAPEDWPDCTEPVLLDALNVWLRPALEAVAGLDELTGTALEQALWGHVGPQRRRALDELAPERFTTPAGTSHAVDYAAEGGPRVEVRVQALFGLGVHPTVGGGRVPLTLALLSPAHRPVQLTKDLPSFWKGSWKAVRTEMRGRYPKHPWPEDPLAASPTTRAKPRGS